MVCYKIWAGGRAPCHFDRAKRAEKSHLPLRAAKIFARDFSTTSTSVDFGRNDKVSIPTNLGGREPQHRCGACNAPHPPFAHIMRTYFWVGRAGTTTANRRAAQFCAARPFKDFMPCEQLFIGRRRNCAVCRFADFSCPARPARTESEAGGEISLTYTHRKKPLHEIPPRATFGCLVGMT